MDKAATKSLLRKNLRTQRRAHVKAQPDAIRGLLFHRPPAPLLTKFSDEAIIGLYYAAPYEAPTQGYARFFHESGHRIALPAFSDVNATMHFAEHKDPFGGSDLTEGPFGIQQPSETASEVVPDIIFTPLIGFTASGQRLGQGGGHYDRWLSEHPGRIVIGLAWDVQLIEPEHSLPIEAHDMPLDAIVTPTRIYGSL